MYVEKRTVIRESGGEAVYSDHADTGRKNLYLKISAGF